MAKTQIQSQFLRFFKINLTKLFSIFINELDKDITGNEK